MNKILIALLFCSGSAMAEFKDGNTLLREMQDEGFVGPSIAMGYVIGVFDVYSKSLVCLPNGVTAGQIKDVVQNWLVANPQNRHFSADSLVLSVLKSTWPCRAGKAL